MKTATPEWKLPDRVWPALALSVATLACLLPFIDKAFHVDDPLFVWSGRQIQSHPFDFYGFSLNWDGREAPMAAVTQNPPLAAYFLALIGSLFGWSETALHAGFLLPAIAAVVGTHCLAHRFCSRPLWAALATVTAPVFVLSGTSVMCDMMMLALWVWSAFFWINGLKSGSAMSLCVAALLVTACSLTKYFGLSLVPLLLAYSVLERRRAGPWLVCLSLPVIGFACYLWLAHRLYGQELLLNAAAYATHLRVGGGLTSKLLAGLAFAGGCMIVLLFAAPLLWSRKGLAGYAAAAAVIGLLVLATKEAGSFPVVEAGNVKWLYVIQLAALVAAGGSLVVLAAGDWLRSKTPLSAFLFLWVAGTLVFACAVNWTVSGRNFLPMLPAVSLLLIRRLEARDSLPGGKSVRRLRWPLVASLLLAMLVAWADCRLADSARNAALDLNEKLRPASDAIRFEGHWGFQYYMERLGAKALDRTLLDLLPGQVIVVPVGNSYLFPLPEERVTFWFRYKPNTLSWLATMNGSCGAGYYSDGWGPLPFVFGPAPAEEYLVFRVR